MRLLDGNRAPDAVRAAVDAVPGVQYVDQVADISHVLGEYRRIAAWLMLVVIGVMLACALVYSWWQTPRETHNSKVAIASTEPPKQAAPRPA